ncbi:hypothetical protein CPC08DRAFT_745012 [Agrocybe pediades]|nr:hypothetical protein CPC08DRAFT_745012 [Agrocybe pediades]
MIFGTTFFAMVAAAVAATGASAVAVANIASEAEIMHFIATTDAKLTFIGNPIQRRNALDTTVVYCSSRVDNVCGGACTVYSGGPTCLNAPDTQCLSATSNVGFCDRGGCGGSCNEFASCGTRLSNNFCFTPGTASILVGA